MAQVDFYILKAQYHRDRYHFACRLTEKVYKQGHRAYLHASNDGEVRHLDRLLWTFREGSFIPHGVLDDADPRLTPVLLGSQRDPSGEDDVLINLDLAPEIPDFFNRFQRIAEIVDADPERLRAGRTRFRYYRDQGCPLYTHELSQ